MGFIKNALIGIALYEAVKYFLKKGNESVEMASEGAQGAIMRQTLRDPGCDVIAGARQTDHIRQAEENALSAKIDDNDGSSISSVLTRSESIGGFITGENPTTPLTGYNADKIEGDSWKDSLANNELRAPDS